MGRGGLLGVALLLAVAGGGCGTGGLSEGGSASQGQPLFNEKCGSCHTLRAAGTQGVIGPNLDDAFAQPRKDGIPDSTILEVVRRQIEFPVPADVSVGTPPMPANLVEGEDADSVAAYVASVAAVPDAPVAAPPPAPPPSGGGGGGRRRRRRGDLLLVLRVVPHARGRGHQRHDRPEPRRRAARRGPRARTRHERMGVMPSFKDQLSEAQIAAVAKYVSENAGQ